jgi:hypothetical protein
LLIETALIETKWKLEDAAKRASPAPRTLSGLLGTFASPRPPKKDDDQ